MSVGVEKHLQDKQGNNPNTQYLPEAGIPMLNSKQAWPRTIHSESMSKENIIKMYTCTFMSAKYPGIHGTLTWNFNLAQLGKCIDE